MSYPEVCSKLPNPSNTHLKGEHQPLRRSGKFSVQRISNKKETQNIVGNSSFIGDPTHRYGSYAYRIPDENGNYGLWVGYEDPESAQSKASYVVNKNLGGVAIHDLTNDDFRGSCTGDKYPILRAAKYRLTQPN